ncbi:MAG TPA: hypothetical protein VFR81_02655 [Longimicrobium sp.]|nr:hypothetical protein [Longimicrobium sp.]
MAPREPAEGGEMRRGDPVDGLRLGIASSGSAVLLRLENVGDAPLEVLSHVSAREDHLDWHALRLEGLDGAVRTLRFRDVRDKAGIARARLAPGGTLDHRVDPAAWALRGINGGVPLAPGRHRATALYDTAGTSSGDHWRGRLSAGPVDVDIR